MPKTPDDENTHQLEPLVRHNLNITQLTADFIERLLSVDIENINDITDFAKYCRQFQDMLDSTYIAPYLRIKKNKRLDETVIIESQDKKYFRDAVFLEYINNNPQVKAQFNTIKEKIIAVDDKLYRELGKHGLINGIEMEDETSGLLSRFMDIFDQSNINTATNRVEISSETDSEFHNIVQYNRLRACQTNIATQMNEPLNEENHALLGDLQERLSILCGQKNLGEEKNIEQVNQLILEYNIIQTKISSEKLQEVLTQEIENGKGIQNDLSAKGERKRMVLTSYSTSRFEAASVMGTYISDLEKAQKSLAESHQSQLQDINRHLAALKGNPSVDDITQARDFSNQLSHNLEIKAKSIAELSKNCQDHPSIQSLDTKHKTSIGRVIKNGIKWIFEKLNKPVPQAIQAYIKSDTKTKIEQLAENVNHESKRAHKKH